MGYQSSEVSGVGGWLAFFLVTLGVFTPLNVGFALFQTFTAQNEVGDDWAAIRIIYLIGNGSIIATAWFITWRLLRVRKWQSVRIAVGGLCLIAVVPHAFEIIAGSLVTGAPIGNLVAGWGYRLFQPLIYSAVWTAYLLQSARVWNTYPRDDEDDGEDLANVFE